MVIWLAELWEGVFDALPARLATTDQLPLVVVAEPLFLPFDPPVVAQEPALMPFQRVLIPGVLVAFMIAVAAAWWHFSAPAAPTNAGIAGIAITSAGAGQSAETPPLRPSVVTAATKLGQGRRAVAGLPSVSDYDLPVLRETRAGLALQIADTPLPATTAHQFSVPEAAPDSADAQRLVRFDIYSWFEGVLVASTKSPVALSATLDLQDVPNELEQLAPQFAENKRLLLVVPVGAIPQATQLNPHDAYIVVAERVN